jgi:hypothetical protein
MNREAGPAADAELHREGRGFQAMKSKANKPRVPRGKGGRKIDADETNQATGAEFEREGMGIAPKE